MPAPLSIDLRQRVMAAYQAKEGSQRQLAERFKLKRVVCARFDPSLPADRHSRAKTTWRWSGCEIGKRTSCQLCKRSFEAQPDALLVELCERFAETTAVNMSVSTMQRAVQSLELSVKKNIDCS